MYEKQIEVQADSRKGPDHYTTNVGIDDDTAIPGGQLDPIYEKKARLLNRAVRVSKQYPSSWSDLELTAPLDPRYWHGLVPMAAVHRGWVWLGL